MGEKEIVIERNKDIDMRKSTVAKVASRSHYTKH